MTAIEQTLRGLLRGGVVDAGDIARVLGTTPRSVGRWRADGVAPRRDAEERLCELLAVARVVKTRHRAVARAWMRTPNARLAWDKPLDVLAAGRYRDVLEALEAT